MIWTGMKRSRKNIMERNGKHGTRQERKLKDWNGKDRMERAERNGKSGMKRNDKECKEQKEKQIGKNRI
jgi:hypothetical protein